MVPRYNKKLCDWLYSKMKHVNVYARQRWKWLNNTFFEDNYWWSLQIWMRVLAQFICVFHVWWYTRQDQSGYTSDSSGEILKHIPSCSSNVMCFSWWKPLGISNLNKLWSSFRTTSEVEPTVLNQYSLNFNGNMTCLRIFLKCRFWFIWSRWSLVLYS